jgi:hypothetical protein
MNWGWANYLGLNSANLLNNANVFVGPSQESLAAAFDEMTLNNDGTYSLNAAKMKNSAGYSLPSIIYAAVSTDAMPDARKAQIQAALGAMLDVTGGEHSSSLPAGYVKLPDALYTQALAEVQNAVGNPNFDIGTVLPALATAKTTGGKTSFTSPSSVTSRSTSTKTGTGEGSTSNKPRVIPSSSPTYGALVAQATGARLMIPSVAALVRRVRVGRIDHDGLGAPEDDS